MPEPQDIDHALQTSLPFQGFWPKNMIWSWDQMAKRYLSLESCKTPMNHTTDLKEVYCCFICLLSALLSRYQTRGQSLKYKQSSKDLPVEVKLFRIYGCGVTFCVSWKYFIQAMVDIFFVFKESPLNNLARGKVLEEFLWDKLCTRIKFAPLCSRDRLSHTSW